MELLCMDDHVLIAEKEKLLLEKLRKWKKEIEMKGLRTSM